MGARPLTPLGLQMIAALPSRLQTSVDYQAVIHAVSRELDRIEQTAEQVRTNSDPAEADVLLPAWELETGQPVGGSGQTLGQRQQAVVTALSEVIGAGMGSEWEKRITGILGGGWSYEEGQGNPPANLVTHPSFTRDTVGAGPGGWTNNASGLVTTGAVITTQASGGAAGGRYPRVVSSGSATNMGAAISLGVLPAGSYVASVYLKGNAGGEVVALGAGLVTPPSLAQVSATLTTAWQRFYVPFTADGSTSKFLFVRIPAATAVTFGFDRAMVDNPPLVDYGDGDTPSWVWSGTAGASTSSDPAPAAYTLRIVLPFAPSGPLYDQTLVKIREWTPAHLEITFASTAGFLLDESELDVQELTY